jgi:elongation factor Ts
VEIKATDVKKLREITGAGMMDCKKALQEADGDFEKAEKVLKEHGLAAAAKREGRATNEGRVFTSVQESRAAIVELSCETDFVARNETFVELGNTIAGAMVESGSAAESFADKIQDAVTTIKENMAIRRGAILDAGEDEILRDYVHGETGRVGVVVKVKVGSADLKENSEVQQFAFDVALHVAAFRPTFLSTETVDQSYLAEQEAIFTAQAKQLDKPENVVQGIAKGKLKKHLSEICLLEQGFVKDEKRTVAQAAADLGKSVGGTVAVSDYVYYMVGQEG